MVASDIFHLQTIVDVTMSPDGRHIAFVVHTCDEYSDREYATLWMTAVDSGDPQPLTSGHSRDFFPRWSPDGDRLAFLSDRPVSHDGSAMRSNIFAIDMRRPGEPTPLTNAPGNVSDFIWAPDGQRLCVVMTDPQPHGDHVGRSSLRYDSMRYSDPPFTAFIDDRYDHLWLVNADGSMGQLTHGQTNDWSPTWSPDGRTIAFVSNRRSDREFRHAGDVWIVQADGNGSERPLHEAAATSDWDGGPAFSPRGDEIAYIGLPDDAVAQHRPHPHLLVTSLGNGSAEDLLDGWDRPVGNHLLSETRRHVGAPPAVWSREGQGLFFLGTDRGTAHLYHVERAGGEPESLTPGDHEVVAFSFDADRQSFAAVISSAMRPPELFVGTRDGELRQVTDLNGQFMGELDDADLERFVFRADDGCEIEGWLVKPADYEPGRRYPVVLRIAGGPGLAYGHSFVEDSLVLAGRGYLVCFINPRGTQSYGAQFAAALDDGWLRRDYEDQTAAIDHLVDAGIADPKRLGVMGASYGGLMVNWIVTQTDRFAAAVSQRSISNLISEMGIGGPGFRDISADFKGANPHLEPEPYIQRSPLTHVKNVVTPILLMQAGQDCITPVGQALEFFVALRSLGKRARLVVFPEGLHFLRRYGKPSERVEYMEVLVEWFDEHLRGDQSA